jgi:hypothetical protein
MIMAVALHLKSEGAIGDEMEHGVNLCGVLISGKEETKIVLVVVDILHDVMCSVSLWRDMDGPRIDGASAAHMTTCPWVILAVDLYVLCGRLLSVLVQDVEGDVIPADIELITCRDRRDGSG